MLNKMPTVQVLLSTFNGEAYISQLLDSIFSQRDVEVTVLARDDGSHDKTVQILREYAKSCALSIIEIGPNLGYAKSFWTLLQKAGEADYYAFADQDDIWLPCKLINSIRELTGCTDAALCTSTVIPVDAVLHKLEIEPFPKHGPLALSESLQRSILPGCTYVFNERLRALASRYNGFMESHDWALYAIATALGQVKYCETPGIKYRIHGANTIGVANKTASFFSKLKRLGSPSERTRSRFAKDLLQEYWSDLDNDSREIVALLAWYRDSIANRIALVLSPVFKGRIFKLYGLLGRL